MNVLSFSNAIFLLFLYTSGIVQSEQVCYIVNLEPLQYEEFNFTTQEWSYGDGEMKYDLLDAVGNSIERSNNASVSQICVGDNEQCHYWFFRGNGRFHIAFTTANDEEAIEYGEVSYGNPVLLRMGDCANYCNDDNQQLLFVGEANDYPTLYSNENKVVESLLDRYFDVSVGNNTGTTVEEDDVVLSLACIHSRECYRLVGSAVYFLTDAAGTTIDMGSTVDGYKTFEEESNCYSLCDEVPLLGDTLRGQQILLAVSSVSGTEALKNVNSPQHRAACFLVHEDAQQHVASDDSLLQRYILAVLYYTLGGSRWRRNHNFLTPRNECDWNSYNGVSSYSGVYCDANGRVVGIAMRGNYLQGTLPNELSFLIDVRYIYLSDNSLVGTIPSQLSALQSLHHFELQRNTLTGSFPDSIGEIQALQVLDLEDNGLTGSIPSPFQGDMIIFRLNRNNIDGTIPNEISKWTSLRHFFVSGTNVHGTIPEGIGDLTTLEIVYLENNFLSGTIPSKMLALPRLQALRLHENSLTGSIPSTIATDSPLATLRLHYNKLTGTIPFELSTLRNLGELLLHNNALTGEIQLSFSTQNEVGSFHFQNNNISGSVPSELCGQVRDIKADCGAPSKVDCECCTCNGIFSPRTKGLGAQSEDLPCAAAELTFRLDKVFPGDLIELEFFDSEGSKTDFVSLTAPGTSFTYKRCVSMTGCYRIRVMKLWNLLRDDWDMTVTVNDDIVLAESVTERFTDYFLGFSSSDGGMRKDACDAYSLCDTVVETNSKQRELVDLLMQTNNIELFSSTSSSHYKASCRWASYLQENSDYLCMDLIQYFYLAVFYFENNGEQWFDSASWVTNDPLCTWFGIDCDEDDVVTSISLSSNNLLGTVTSEIGELRGLEAITLSDNHLFGSIPVELGVKLQRLKHLIATNNSLTGSLPTEVGKLEEIVEIDLSHNRLTNGLPTEIGNLNSIEVLNLFRNTLTGEIPYSVAQATSLKVLHLSDNLFVGSVNAAEALVQLESLHLSDNYFTGSVPVGLAQKNLQVLDLSGNIFTGSLPPTIGEMTALERLYIYNNQLTGNLPSELGELSNLQEVALSHNRIKGRVPHTMGRLENLTRLHLHSNMLEGTSDHFDYSIDDFITDCGGTFTEPALVECTTCSACCNNHGACLRRDSTWPGDIIQASSLQASGFVFLMAFVSCIALLICLVLFNYLFKQDSEFIFCREFQEESTYKLLMTNSPVSWILAGLTLLLQCLVLWIFLEASDFTDSRSDWEYSLSCPENSIFCFDRKHISALAWFAFTCILVTFLAKDFFDGFKMMYESLILGSRRGIFAGFVVVFVTIISVLASIFYNRSTGMSDTDVLKDAAILLFLNEIDEKLYMLVKAVYPSWMEDRNNFIAKHIVKRSTRQKGCVESSKYQDPKEEFEESMHDEVISVKDYVQKLEKELEDLHMGQFNVEKKYDNLKSDYFIMENKYKDEIDVHKREIDTIKCDVMKVEKLENDYANLQDSHAQLRKDHTKLQSHNCKLQNDHVRLEGDLRDLKEIFGALEQKLQQKYNN